MSYEYALRTYVRRGYYWVRSERLINDTYTFTALCSPKNIIDGLNWFRLSSNVHHNFSTFIRRKLFQTEYMEMPVWPQHSITLVEIRFCFISMFFAAEGKLHSYII